MKILRLLFISGIIKQFTTDTRPGIPFFTTTKISNMKKNLSKEGPTQRYNVEVPVFGIKYANFDIFNINSTFFKTSIFPNFLTDSKCTSKILQFFYDKIKFLASYFTITQNEFFITSMPIENNISTQPLNMHYGDISLNQYEFLCFPLMQNDKTDRPFKFNVYSRLTAVFSMMIVVVYVNFFQKKPLFLQKFYLTNYELKTNEKKKHQNVIIFVIFSINSFQLFYDNNLTLTITNSNDFSEIDQYKNITKFINISEGIYTIPSGAFSGWPLVISVNFGNSISYIGGSAFSSCSHLETIIFGGNVTYISGSAFSFCSSIKNITIPNSATLIGGYAFSFCSNLMILTLGSGITEIGDSAFSNCNSLECIYYYGDTEPNIGENAFCNVTAIVITYPTYIESNFGKLKVIKSYAEGNCKPIPTLSFSASDIYSQSNTFSLSNTYSQSNTFSQTHSFSINTFSKSNTFTESYQNDLTKSFSYLITVTLSFTYSFTYYEIQTKSLSLFTINSSNIYIETEFIYYDYTVIIYSTYYIYYSNFFTFIYNNEFQTKDNKTTKIIIIVCVIVIIIIISLLILLLIRIKNKKEEIAENEISEQQNDNNQTTNTFVTGISISNIEEDPFADDFKEEKFIEQM